MQRQEEPKVLGKGCAGLQRLGSVASSSFPPLPGEGGCCPLDTPLLPRATAPLDPPLKPPACRRRQLEVRKG
eukprot:15450101-Alexandrium_andersonii.AAC.1